MLSILNRQWTTMPFCFSVSSQCIKRAHVFLKALIQYIKLTAVDQRHITFYNIKQLVKTIENYYNIPSPSKIPVWTRQYMRPSMFYSQNWNRYDLKTLRVCVVFRQFFTRRNHDISRDLMATRTFETCKKPNTNL